MKTYSSIMVLFLFFFGNTTIGISQPGKKTLQELANQAPVIILGTVQSIESQYEEYLGKENFIFTYATIFIESSIKGSRSGIVKVKIPGGEKDGRATYGKLTFKFQKNEEVLLFLDPIDNENYQIHGVSGKLTTIRENGIKYFDTTIIKNGGVSRNGDRSKARHQEIINQIINYLKQN